MTDDTVSDVGAALVLVSIVGVPVYAILVTWFPSHRVAGALLYLAFVLGAILLAYGEGQ